MKKTTAFMKNIFPLLLMVLAFPAVAKPTEEAPVDGFYERTLFKDKGVIPYEYVRESDVIWEKRIWRVVDVREKMNLFFAYPKEPLIQIFLDAAYAGDITVYSPTDDQFTTKMTPDEVKSIGRRVDTIMVTDPITLIESPQIVQQDLDIEKIRKFRIKEDWFFDKETSTQMVRVMGIAPIIDRYDENGNFVGELPMFWIYYPHVRQLLAHHESFNRMNDAVRLTWYNVFEMRTFSSYIIKISNEYDRRITDYATGVEALLEGDSKKMELFNYEHDVWSW